uniref:Kinesin motor domain-containing protein n=1 Tax=Meloidogyne hapla TaxID=6305 RepID=A0A1I8AYI4_MELHA
MTIKNGNTSTILSTTSDKVRVAVRVRPLIAKKGNILNIVKISNNSILLSHTNDVSTNPKQFAYDFCFPSTSCQQQEFNSSLPSSIASTSSFNSTSNLYDQKYNLLEGTQEHLFQTIGLDVINNAFLGFNTCVFAYGQTGSGKSYTMMGTKEEPGLIPRLCKELFQRINSQDSNNIKLEISFYEVYNERIRDLLGNSKLLKVREHSIYGPTVEGLSIFPVNNVEQIERFIAIGNKQRSTAATLMNDQSSRSHSVFSIKMTQIIVAVEDKNFTGETVSKISLVDLAGSERVQKTGAIGKRLEEGSNINKSLTALGKVIAALASNKNNGMSTQPKGGTNNNYFVPYRDSVLTWLLKENLGGNSRTTMIATISPSSEHYEETLSTLRFADRAKRIQTNAVVNEDPNAKIIRELREEVERLKKLNETTQAQQQEALEEAMAQIAEQHNKEKQIALERQYEEFAEYIRDLLIQNNTQSSPYSSVAATPSGPFPGIPPFFDNGNIKNDKNKFLEWAQERDQLFTARLEYLQQKIQHANKLCSDANLLSEMFARIFRKTSRVYYSVNLHIPINNLKPSALNFKRKNSLNEEENEFLNCICEPVILAVWGILRQNTSQSFSKEIANGSFQQFSIGEINLKLEEMREAISTVSSNTNLTICDGFNKWDDDFEECNCNKRSFIWEKQSLVGVANVYLGALLHNLSSPLQTQVLIINQQGEISGKLHVQIHRTALLNTSDSMDFYDKDEAEDNFSEDLNKGPEQLLGQTIVAKVEILKATNLPSKQSHFVFCQYSFFDQPQVIIPSIIEENERNVNCNSSDEFELIFTQTFLDYLQEDALSIEIWGHKTPLEDEEEIEEKQQKENYLNNFVEQKMQTLQERWKEVTKRLELFFEILELNDVGEYIPVSVDTEQNCASGGIYRLRPGQQRRLCISISSLKEDKNGGSLPLHLEDISSISVGSIILIEGNEDEKDEKNSKKLLDSYQENDLIRLRQNWNNLLLKREKYLQKEFCGLNDKKEENDERENSLLFSWVELIEERNAISLPTKEGIPGALVDLMTLEGFEKHCPIIFLDREEDNEDEFNLNEKNLEYCKNENVIFIGEDCLLLGENTEDDSLELVITEKNINQSHLSFICPWDSSLHECPAMNRESKIGEYTYVIVKLIIRISQPINASLVLKKRLCLQFISFEQRSQNLSTSRWPALFSSWPSVKKVGNAKQNAEEEEIIKNEEKRIGTGLFVDIVGFIPKCTLEMEKREILAKLAIRNINLKEIDKEEKTKEFINEIEKQPKLNEYLSEYLSKTIQSVEWLIKMDRLRQEETINSIISKAKRIRLKPSSSSYNNTNIENINSLSLQMKRTISLPNKICNFLTPSTTISSPSTNFSSKSSKQQTSKINNNKHLINRLPQSQSHNEGFNFVDSPSPNSSGYASLASSSAGQFNLRLTGIEEEENQLNVSPASEFS